MSHPRRELTLGFVETDPERPYAFIQWKGTQVCMDWYCECGEQAHTDDDFAYAVECPHCHQRYEVGCYVSMRRTADLGIPTARSNP